MVYDPNAAAKKQISRAQNATQDYKDGVMRVTQSPTALAANKLDKYQAGINAALASGKTKANMQAVSLADWQHAATNKGGQRYSQGVQAAADKIAQFHAQFAPFMAGVQQQIKALPDTTPEDRINKCVANIRAISKFKFSKGMRS